LRFFQSVKSSGRAVPHRFLGMLDRHRRSHARGDRPEHAELRANVGVFESLRHENHLLASLDDAIEHARTHVAHRPH
jgi:hypothetical protein